MKASLGSQYRADVCFKVTDYTLLLFLKVNAVIGGVVEADAH